MAKFLGIIRGGTDKMATLSPDDLQAHMQKWYDWIDSIKDVYLGGDPLQGDRKILRGKNGQVVFDGPYTEAKEIVGGYIMIEADSLEAAVEIGKGCPVIDMDGSLELGEINPLNMK